MAHAAFHQVTGDFHVRTYRRKRDNKIVHQPIVGGWGQAKVSNGNFDEMVRFRGSIFQEGSATWTGRYEFSREDNPALADRFGELDHKLRAESDRIIAEHNAKCEKQDLVDDKWLGGKYSSFLEVERDADGIVQSVSIKSKTQMEKTEWNGDMQKIKANKQQMVVLAFFDGYQVDEATQEPVTKTDARGNVRRVPLIRNPTSTLEVEHFEGEAAYVFRVGSFQYVNNYYGFPAWNDVVYLRTTDTEDVLNCPINVPVPALPTVAGGAAASVHASSPPQKDDARPSPATPRKDAAPKEEEEAADKVPVPEAVAEAGALEQAPAVGDADADVEGASLNRKRGRASGNGSSATKRARQTKA